MDSARRSHAWSSDSGGEDSRKTLRYEVRARAMFHWSDGNGISRESQGFTRDVSPKGAYVFAGECPPRGTQLEMVIDLPSLGKGSNDIRIRAECRVVRVDEKGGAAGVQGFSVQNSRVSMCAN